MKSTKLSPLTEPTVLEFLDTATNLVRRLDQALSIIGISFSEYRLLAMLSGNKVRGCSRINLAQAVGLTPSAVTRALQPLEKLGYVSNKRNERDARQSMALITPAGLQLLENGQSVVNDLLKDLPLNLLTQATISEFKLRLLDLQ